MRLLFTFLTLLPYSVFSFNNGIDSNDVKNLNLLYKEANKSNPSELKYIPLLLRIDSLSLVLGDTESSAEINSRIGSYYFQRDADKAIHYLKVAAKNYKLNNNKPFQAFSYLNIASALDEKKKDFSNSALFLDSAITIWKVLGDIRNEANLHKYKGLILAKQGRIVKGKEEAFLAIKQFNSISYLQGTAVSYFDLARIFELNSESDSAIHYINKAIDFWQAEKDTFRIVTNRNFLFNLYLKKSDFSAAGIQLQLIDKHISTELHWQTLINFYYLSKTYFDKIGKTEKANEYAKKYNDLQQQLKQKSINAISEYQ